MSPYNFSTRRRRFLATTTLGAAGALYLPDSARSQAPRERPAPLTPLLVHEFVRVAHGNLDRVKELLAEQPALLNSTWDWGGGDWEAAIGGAGHMGRADIANYLLSQGARMDIFVAAMLGKLDIVRATLTAYSELLHSRGPHGITLMAHAKAGSTVAEPVVEYLEGLALARIPSK